MKLVLLPGMDGTGQLFAPLIVALGTEVNARIVAYPTSAELGYAELQEVAQASLPTQGPFVILGESFSGPIAISLAASSAQGLKGLILCCSFVRNPRPAMLGIRSLVDRIPFDFVPTSIVSVFLLGRFSTPDLRSALRQALSQVSSGALRARLNAVANVDVSAQLAAIKVPVLCLTSLRDRVVPQSAAAEISRLMPAARVVSIDAPHFMLQAKPEHAAREIKGFLSEVAVSSAEGALR